MTPKQRMKQLIRNYERHLSETHEPPKAPDAFLYMDMCDLLNKYDRGLADDAMLEKLLAKVEGAA